MVLRTISRPKAYRDPANRRVSPRMPSGDSYDTPGDVPVRCAVVPHRASRFVVGIRERPKAARAST